MLVLSRTVHETVRVKIPPTASGMEIEVAVVRLTGHNVRLGFTAPPEVNIVRSEIPDIDLTRRA